MGYGFLSCFLPFFLLYRNCKRLREFEEIGISSKAVEVAVNNKSKTLRTFVRTSSRNSVSGCQQFNPPWPPSSPLLSPPPGPTSMPQWPPPSPYPFKPLNVHLIINSSSTLFHPCTRYATSRLGHISASLPHQFLLSALFCLQAQMPQSNCYMYKLSSFVLQISTQLVVLFL